MDKRICAFLTGDPFAATAADSTSAAESKWLSLDSKRRAPTVTSKSGIGIGTANAGVKA